MNSSTYLRNRFSTVVVPTNLCELPLSTVAIWVSWLLQNGNPQQLAAAAWQLRLCSVKPYHRAWFQALYARANELTAQTYTLPPSYTSSQRSNTVPLSYVPEAPSYVTFRRLW